MKKLIILLSILAIIFNTDKVFSQPQVGQTAPVISGLKMIDKEQPNLIGKFVFLDFWATWCGPCIKSLPHLNVLAGKYKDKVVFLALSDEKESVVRNFLQNKHYDNLTFALDVQQNCNTDYSIKFIPTYYLISPENTILATGFSSELTDNHLDSIITQYLPLKSSNPALQSNNPSQIVISKDSTEKVSSIEILLKPGSKRLLRNGTNSFVVRDTLRYVLPYLTGVKVANRIRWEKTFGEMIEIKAFSRNEPIDSLKKGAHDVLMASFGIHKKQVIEPTTVFRLEIYNPRLLKNKNTIIEEGVAKRYDLLNDSTYLFDNCTLKEVVAFLENAYYPRIIYADPSFTDEYDWTLVIVDPSTHRFVNFDRLKQVLRSKQGIEITEEVKNEIFTIYF